MPVSPEMICPGYTYAAGDTARLVTALRRSTELPPGRHVIRILVSWRRLRGAGPLNGETPLAAFAAWAERAVTDDDDPPEAA